MLFPLNNCCFRNSQKRQNVKQAQQALISSLQNMYFHSVFFSAELLITSVEKPNPIIENCVSLLLILIFFLMVGQTVNNVHHLIILCIFSCTQPNAVNGDESTYTLRALRPRKSCQHNQIINLYTKIKLFFCIFSCDSVKLQQGKE